MKPRYIVAKGRASYKRQGWNGVEWFVIDTTSQTSVAHGPEDKARAYADRLNAEQDKQP